MATVKAVITIESKESPEVAKLVSDLFKTLKIVLKTDDIVTIGIGADGKIACKGAAMVYKVAKVDPDPELPFEKPAPVDCEVIQEATFELAPGEKQSDYNEALYATSLNERIKIFNRAVENLNLIDPISGRAAAAVVSDLEDKAQEDGGVFDDANQDQIYSAYLILGQRLSQVMGHGKSIISEMDAPVDDAEDDDTDNTDDTEVEDDAD